MTMPEALDQGRAAYEARAWREAYTHLAAVDRAVPLDLADLERLAFAAHLVGEDEASSTVWARAHQEALRQGDVMYAVRCAFWAGFELLNLGQMAPGAGWFARAERLLAAHPGDCAERGYLLLPRGMELLEQGDLPAATDAFREALRLGESFGDSELTAFARHGTGRALIRSGETAAGVRLLDEVMVAITSGEVAPVVVGDVYCGVIAGCQEVFDLRRAQEWTTALTRWCDAQPELIRYRGECRLFRAEMLQWRGDWQAALDEAGRARDQLAAAPGHPATGDAHYRLAEIQRLRGETEAAEESYRHASGAGRRPEPGLALLRIAQGRVADAAVAIRRELDETRDRLNRAPLLAAAVEIELAAGHRDEAAAAAEELREAARRLQSPLLQALAATARGAVALASGNARDALPILRDAQSGWSELNARCEGARVRVLIAEACDALSDHDHATLEREAARAVFAELGAQPDLARLDGPPATAAPADGPALSPRELEVLRLIAAGATNRDIAAALTISEKTVARHVSNLYAKLDLSTRSAATAYAYDHGLV